MKALILVLSMAAVVPADAGLAPLGSDKISPAGFRAMVAGRGTWVAVDDHGRLMASSDRIGWTLQARETVFALYAVAFGNGRFVAVGNEGALLSSVTAWIGQRRILGPMNACGELPSAMDALWPWVTAEQF